MSEETKKPESELMKRAKATHAQLMAIETPTYADFIKDDGDLDLLMLFYHLTEKTTPNADKMHHREFLETFGVAMTEEGNMALDLTKDKEGKTISQTLFTAHVDTADRGESKTVKHYLQVTEDRLYVMTDGKTYLGADDKAGMVVLLNLIHNQVPGYYYFFHGEESGGVGSRKAAGKWDWSDYKRAVAFDRNSEGSVITYQRGKRSCSDKFAEELIKGLTDGGVKLTADTGGSFTDTASFFEEIPECTNISVGYTGFHSNNEKQNITYLENLSAAAVAVKWEELPTDETLLNNRPSRYGGGYHQTHRRETMTVERLDKLMDAGTINLSDIGFFISDNGAEAQKIIFKAMYGHNWPYILVEGKPLQAGDRLELKGRKFTVVALEDYGLKLKADDSTLDKFMLFSEIRREPYTFVKEEEDAKVLSN